MLRHEGLYNFFTTHYKQAKKAPRLLTLAKVLQPSNYIFISIIHFQTVPGYGFELKYKLW